MEITSESRAKKFLATRNCLLILWLLTFLSFFLAAFSGGGTPFFSYVGHEQISRLAESKHNETLLDIWHEGEKSIAKIQGREYQDPRQIKQPSLASTWKFWIIFAGLLVISLAWSSVVAVGKAGQVAKKGAIYSGQGVKGLDAYIEKKISKIWNAINEAKTNRRIYKLMEEKVKISSGATTIAAPYPWWKAVYVLVLGGLALLGLLKVYGFCRKIMRR